MRRVISIFCGVMVVAAFAEQQPYERYQSIVERQMFGAPPVGFDPTKMPSEVAKTKGKADQELSQEQEQIKKAIKFSVLNVTSEGEIIVGFSDNGDAKNPLHYYLKVGESQNGWTVKEADKDEATMTIEKEGIEVTLKLGGDSASDANAVSRTSASNAASRNSSGRTSLLGGAQSLRSRRQQERQQMQEDAKKRAEEDKARAEREEIEKQQREAEREEQRNQLMQIQNELRKAREAREAQRKQEQEAQETAETPSDEHSDETSKESEE